MTTIHAKVMDQVFSATILPRVARGSQNAVKLHVDFNDDWREYAKIAVFTTAIDPTPYEMPLSALGDCLVPPEVLADDGYLFISIRGVNGNRIRSTTAIRYKVLPGTPSLVVSDPTKDIYQELLTAYGKSSGELAAESVARQKEIAVERTRIDAMLALKDGSTTGDAELQDIRIDANGKMHPTAGAAVREQTTALIDTFANTSQIMRIKDFVKRGNITKIETAVRTNTDGTTRGVTANIADKSRGMLYGEYPAINSYMPITGYINLKAGETYSVYMIDEAQAIDYNVFLYDSNGGTYQEGGKNKIVLSAMSIPFNTITPEKDGTYRFGIFLNFNHTFSNDNIFLYIVPGEYTFDDFVYMHTKEETDTFFDSVAELASVPKRVAENSLAVIKNTVVLADGVAIRRAKRYNDALCVLNGYFAAETVTNIGELFELEAGEVYTVYAVGDFAANARIIFLDKGGLTVHQYAGKNVTATANGITHIISDVGGFVQPCLYSVENQTFTNKSLELYILKGAHSVDKFRACSNSLEVKIAAENADDLSKYAKKICDSNIITMITTRNGKGTAEPSALDRSITILNGNVHAMRITNTFQLEAGKVYTVCAIDNVKDVNYHVFFANASTDIPVTVGGVNKSFAVISGTFFGTFSPDVSATVYAYLYNDTGKELSDRYFRLFVLEGEYSFDSLLSGAESTFDYVAYGLPVVRLFGSTYGISKDNKVTLNYEYGDRSGTCSLKWQGSSSLSYPKKNYTIDFDTPFEAKAGWGEQTKYCLKANYIDFSHARNVISATLWGQIVKSRVNENTRLSALPNGGAIDGFPIVLVINNAYQGIYTFNIPKDAWMFGMVDGLAEYVVTAETHSAVTRFKEETTLEELQNEAYFAIEHKPDSVEDETVLDSLNALISACVSGTGTNYRDTVAPHMDIESAIDYYIFACLTCATDATDKNYILGTYDGTKWFFSAYDLDTTFGNFWDGKGYYSVNGSPTFVSYKNAHRLMHLIYTYDTAALKTRYAELRNSVLNEANILDTFSNFIAKIPKALYDKEVEIWPGIPGTQTNNIAQIVQYYCLRCKALDAEISAL